MNPTYKPFDIEAAKAGAPLICRDGTPAKFIAHVPEADSSYQVAALIRGEIYAFSAIGCYCNTKANEDLFLAPVKRKAWVNIYEDGNRHETKELADQRAISHRIACVEVEYTEGQGL